ASNEPFADQRESGKCEQWQVVRCVVHIPADFDFRALELINTTVDAVQCGLVRGAEILAIADVCDLAQQLLVEMYRQCRVTDAERPGRNRDWRNTVAAHTDRVDPYIECSRGPRSGNRI